MVNIRVIDSRSMGGRLKHLMIGALALLFSSSLEAQRIDAVGARSRSNSLVIHRHAPALRIAGSVGGAFLGAVAGGFVGANIPAHDCNCDDPGLDEVVFGGFAGLTLGAALGAAWPDINSVCSRGTRIERSLIGAAVAASVFYVVAGGRGNGGTLIAVPVGAIGGSLAGLGRCWKSRIQS